MTDVKQPAQTSLWQTIVTDLHAGESWFAQEASAAGLFVWNIVKSAFIALGPAEMAIAGDVLSRVVTDAQGGKSIEQMEADALNVATEEERAILVKLGSGGVQTLLAGIKSNQSVLTSG